jgi:hypothetical protein
MCGGMRAPSTALDVCQLNHLENERRCIIGILSLPPPTTTGPNWLLILYWAVIFMSHACLINMGENMSPSCFSCVVRALVFFSDSAYKFRAFTPYDVLFASLSAVRNAGGFVNL